MAGRKDIYLSDETEGHLLALSARWGLTLHDGRPNVSGVISRAAREAVESSETRSDEALEFGDHMAKAIDGWISAAAAGDPRFSFITSGDVLMVDEYRRLRALSRLAFNPTVTPHLLDDPQ